MLFAMLLFITEMFLKAGDKKNTLASSFATLWGKKLRIYVCVMYLFSYRRVIVLQCDSAEEQDNVVSGSELAAFGSKIKNGENCFTGLPGKHTNFILI